MNIDILNIAQSKKGERSIQVALPVIAIQCEATPPIENYLDAYENTALKLVSIGLSVKGISNALHATESLVDEILDSLERKRYVSREIGQPWRLTEDGMNYLEGCIGEREAASSQFGYMFVNAIKKEVLPYFYLGDLNQTPLFAGYPLPYKLTVNGNEAETFSEFTPKRARLRQAYKNYCSIDHVSGQYEERELSFDEAVEQIDLFEDLEDFDEESEEIETSEAPVRSLSNSEQAITKNMFIRALNCKPQFAYLTMNITIDPQYPGGYRVESPFDLNGIDDSFYLRQIQWLVAADNVYINNELLSKFLKNEICQIAPNYKTAEKEYSVFLLEKIPLLHLHQSRFNRVYEDMSRIYSLMQNQRGLLEKENIVSNTSRYVVESLFNEFFRGIKKETMENICRTALLDLNKKGEYDFITQILKGTKLDINDFQWSDGYVRAVLKKLKNTRGNSIVEKFFNVVVLDYYLGTTQTRTFLSDASAQRMYELANQLNMIRRKVSHDTDQRFTAHDYDTYMANVFTLVGNLLVAHTEV